MSDYDTAATIENQRFESGQAGAVLSHLPKHVQAELRRIAPQSNQRNRKFDISFWLRQIEQQTERMGSFNVDRWLERIGKQAEEMGPNALYVPFANTVINDWRMNDIGPKGMYAVAVLNTFLDTLEHLSGADLKDPEKLEFAYRQAEDLMHEIGMSQDQIAELVAKRELEKA